MAKLTAFALVFAALFALSAATTYTTTVITTTTTEANPQGQEEMCESEIRTKKMTHCMQYMCSGMGGQYELSFLRSAVANPRSSEEEHLEKCCEELSNIRPQCRGPAVRRMMGQMKQQYGTQEMEKMAQKARALPQMCHFTQY
ncbi:Unknown protein [Striga hermonthica]|uniref:Bifunctional inhibitor/plant lipid transfer protein/seed storage helical domain-containing protein n=1 Tax=Striga hermonthica TaxID=68872 RepID=A0A9N7NPH0_STRHE|nr:Unknown protein [Striga hermonthica]